MDRRATRHFGTLAGGLLALAAAGALSAQAPAPAGQEGDPTIQESARHTFRVVTVADGLDRPWSMAWLPNGDMLITEKPGRLRIVRGGQLLPEPVAGVPTVRAQGQGGLLEVLPHPDFASNQLIYLSYSKPNADASEATTAVARGRLVNDRIEGLQDIFVAKAWARGNNHFSGRMVFDSEGYLYLTVGDRGEAPNLMAQQPAQHLTTHQGKVLRLHDDGRVPSDNPFVGRSDALPEIWTYGHRNMQGLAIHPETGDLWTNEHGPRGGDEVNVERRSANFGWPVVSYGINYDGTVYTREMRKQGFESPRFTWVPSIGPSGMIIYSGDKFPWWKGNVFVGGMALPQVARLTVQDGEVVSYERLLEGTLGRIRDVRQGPDGYIYIATEDRRGERMTPVVRLEPVQGDVATPQ